MTNPRPGDLFEDGLQRERTALAWNRTAMALIVASSALIGYRGTPYLDLLHIPAYIGNVAGIVVLWLAARDERWQAKIGADAAQLRPSRAWIVGALTLALSIMSLLIILGR